MSVLQAFILGVIQGVTEFLPISSSGHLVLADRILNIPHPESYLTFIVFLHLSSFLAILVTFFKDIKGLFRSERRVLWLIIIGTIPAGVVGLLLEKPIDVLFGSTVVLVGAALLVNAIILLLAEAADWGRAIPLSEMGIGAAFLVGIAQAIAILPGISRSGTTITTGLVQRLSKADAVKFSFFLALPVIAGAAILKLKDFNQFTASFEPISILIGGITCFLVSLAAIQLLIRLVRQSRLYVFAIYSMLLGGTVVMYFISR